MSGKYPEVIDAAALAKYAHVPDDMLVRDITDTEYEIVALTHIEAAERELAQWDLSMNNRRTFAMRADNRPAERAERQTFIDFLKRIQAARAAATGVTA
jgi:hypothetical protein